MERSLRLQNHPTACSTIERFEIGHYYTYIYTIGTRDGFYPIADPTPAGHVRRARSMDGLEPLVILLVHERARYL